MIIWRVEDFTLQSILQAKHCFICFNTEINSQIIYDMSFISYVKTKHKNLIKLLDNCFMMRVSHCNMKMTINILNCIVSF